MENQDSPARPWYKKKRYAVPLAGLATFGGLGMMVGESTQPLDTAVPNPPVVEETRASPPEEAVVRPFKEIQKLPTTAKCHPNYSGCLDINASDYDCAGGSGNGPKYTGYVEVVGPDVFGLDRDGDGYACE